MSVDCLRVSKLVTLGYCLSTLLKTKLKNIFVIRPTYQFSSPDNKMLVKSC